MCVCVRAPLTVPDVMLWAGIYLDDLFALDPATLVWEDLTAVMAGPRPSARANHGFAAAEGRLYVYGGQRASGILLDGDSLSQGEAPLPTGLFAF